MRKGGSGSRREGGQAVPLARDGSVRGKGTRVKKGTADHRNLPGEGNGERIPSPSTPARDGPDREPPRISVVVPVFNALPHLTEAVDSIVEAATPQGNVEIILVDNGSTDGSFEILRSRYGEVARVLRLAEGNVGAVRNHGASTATGEYLSFIDADCCVPPDYFRRALEVVADRGVAATGSTYELPPNPHWIEKTWHALHGSRSDGFVRYLNAGNFFCERSAFEKIGGFDEGLESGEDAEFCQRFRAAGFRIYEAGAVSAVHLGNPKSLPEFFRKQLWHAVGMLGTFRHDWRDLPVLATVAHMAAFLVGLALVLILDPWPVTLVVGFLPLVLGVPVLSVAYRFATARRGVNPLKAVLLYSVYFTARSLAMLRLGLRGGIGR